jgi:hypothetical protein
MDGEPAGQLRRIRSAAAGEQVGQQGDHRLAFQEGLVKEGSRPFGVMAGKGGVSPRQRGLEGAALRVQPQDGARPFRQAAFPEEIPEYGFGDDREEGLQQHGRLPADRRWRAQGRSDAVPLQGAPAKRPYPPRSERSRARGWASPRIHPGATPPTGARRRSGTVRRAWLRRIRSTGMMDPSATPARPWASSGPPNGYGCGAAAGGHSVVAPCFAGRRHRGRGRFRPAPLAMAKRSPTEARDGRTPT